MFFNLCLAIVFLCQCRTFILRKRHQQDPELRSDRIGFWKNAHHLIRRGVGCDIVIGRLAFQQQVTDAASDEVGLMIFLAQRAHHRNGEAL